MENLDATNLSKLVLRLFAGIILLLHGIHKLLHGMDYVFDSIKAIQLPSFFAYGVFLGELVGPMLVIIGFRARIGGLLMALNMLTSVLLMHRDIAFKVNDYGGWMIELNALIMACGLAIFLGGAGKYGLSNKSRWD